MTVRELSREQLEELKARHYTMNNGQVSYEELANIDNYVTDEEIFEEYSCVTFTEDDFSKQPYEVPYKDIYGNEYILIPELRLYDAYDMLTGKNRPLIAI